MSEGRPEPPNVRFARPRIPNSDTLRSVEAMARHDALARFGYALSDATRTRILLSLRESPGYPAELADAIGVLRPTLSNHLACLRDCGLVTAFPEGRRSRYELADPRIGQALDYLLDMALAADPSCCP